MITEITNEALGVPGAAPLTIVANYWFSIVSSFVLALVAAVVTERIVEPRLGRIRAGRGDGRRGICRSRRRGRRSRGGREKRGLRYALFGFLGFLGAGPAVHDPGGRAAPRSGHRRHHRHDAVHGQPAVHHRDVLPDRGHRLRHGRRHVQERERRHRGRDEDVRQPGRPRLHAADDQPVHRLLQFQQPAERARDRAGGVAREPRASGPCRC